MPSLAPYRATATAGAAGEIFGSFAFFFIWSVLRASELRRGRHFAGACRLRLALVGACAVAGLGSVSMMVGYAVFAPAITGLAGFLLLFQLEHPDARRTSSPLLPAPWTWTWPVGGWMAFTAVFAAMLINGDVLLLTMLASWPMSRH